MDARDVFAYTVQLRWRLLDALRPVAPDLLSREMNSNHHSILQTLIHVMAVEESWVREDLEGQQGLTWEQFRDRYLPEESIGQLIQSWHAITNGTVRYLRSHPDLTRVVEIDGGKRAVTVEQILYHLAGEEMIHLGEVLAMTRQQDIDLPSYFLMSIMTAGDRPWEQLLAAAGDGLG